jgi:hypothetical protein
MELPQVGILREVNNDRLNVGIMVDAEWFKPWQTVYFIPHSQMIVQPEHTKYIVVPISDIIALYTYQSDEESNA